MKKYITLIIGLVLFGLGGWGITILPRLMCGISYATMIASCWFIGWGMGIAFDKGGK